MYSTTCLTSSFVVQQMLVTPNVVFTVDTTVDFCFFTHRLPFTCSLSMEISFCALASLCGALLLSMFLGQSCQRFVQHWAAPWLTCTQRYMMRWDGFMTVMFSLLIFLQAKCCYLAFYLAHSPSHSVGEACFIIYIFHTFWCPLMSFQIIQIVGLFLVGSQH